ncbi:TlyA family RNA methyltransferase [Hyphomicrobium sp. 2TAF46]|uniref:TlyA family RNA methyltransferase n=1 Tax=Hyphomicrobium sp. 2TAF46 TaxID=3233019 RepID=UPI003F8F4550
MRLDQMLVTRGLAPSRARAQDLIRRGFVRVGGRVCDKPAQDVSDTLMIEMSDVAPAYVSRGAEKLAAALVHFGFDPSNKVCLDVGASTGGFTEVLLEKGAARVYAVDVGTAQLHPRMKDDPRVVSLENFDARRLSRAEVPDPVAAITVDVSFISVTKLLAPALQLSSPGAWMVVLVKPQFEVGRDNVGSGGIVRDEAARQGALENVRAWIESQPGWSVVGAIPSPILGGSGNSEFLLGARRNG